MKNLKHFFLWWLVFSGTVIISFIWFAAYTSLPTQENWATLNKDIWNTVIDRINLLWTDLDSVKSSYSQLWVWQTRQAMDIVNTSSPNYRAIWTTYTNNTWKPIIVSVFSLIDSNTKTFSLTVSGVIISSEAMTSWYNSRVQSIGIVPNGATYSISANTGIQTWAELR